MSLAMAIIFIVKLVYVEKNLNFYLYIFAIIYLLFIDTNKKLC